jgi:hypothetical protein
MKRFIRFFIGVFLCVAFLAAQADGLGTYDFRIPTAKDLDKDERTPVTTLLGQVGLKNGVQMSVYRLKIESGRSENGWEATMDQLTAEDEADLIAAAASFPASAVAKIDAYVSPVGWFFVPKGWGALRGEVAASGGWALLFGPDFTGEQFLEYGSDGSCMGCAIASASVYFKSAQKDALANDFPYYTKAKPHLTIAILRPTHAAYSYRWPVGLPINGLAIYEPGDEADSFRNIQIRTADTNLVRSLLNYYLPLKRKSN